MVMHTLNPSPQEAVAGGLKVCVCMSVEYIHVGIHGTAAH